MTGAVFKLTKKPCDALTLFYKQINGVRERDEQGKKKFPSLTFFLNKTRVVWERAIDNIPVWWKQRLLVHSRQPK